LKPFLLFLRSTLHEALRVMLLPGHKRFFSLLIPVLCLPFTAVWIRAQGTSTQEEEASTQGKATLFWNSDDSDRGPRWDLSEEPGAFFYVERLRHTRPRDKVVYIAYGPLGEVAWYLSEMKAWLKSVAPVEEDQVLTFDGGRAAQLRYEAWLVPEGAEMPEVTGPPPEDQSAVLAFTNYYYAASCEYCGGQGHAVLKALIEALRQRPQRKAYIEFYGCGSSGRRSRVSVARHEASKARRILIEQGGIAPSRIIVKIKAHGKSSCAAQIRLLPPHLNSPRR
jgi:hypothetical protein